MPSATIPFVDLGRGLDAQREMLLAATDRVLRSGMLIHGAEHARFEGAFAAFVGVAHAVGVGNGTDALELALRATKTDDRRTVLTVANAGGYTATAARAAGLEVAFVDVDPETHVIDPAAVAAAVTDDVFAVVVTHLYGRAADVQAVRAAMSGRDVSIVEDCAQSIGASTPEGMTGSLGDIATFSFYPTKNLGAIGDGGALTTSDPRWAERLRTLRQYGWQRKYQVAVRGGRNSRLDELQAAYLLERLPLVQEWNARRREIISSYAAAASPDIAVLQAPGASHAAHLAVVVCDQASHLADYLEKRGIHTAIHYPVPDHLSLLAGPSGNPLPVTESLVGRILSLPLFPELTPTEVEYVCQALANYVR